MKSHMTPAKLTENTYGERNKEEIHTIDPDSKEISTYFGPSHPQTHDQTIKPAPNSRKAIFCKGCETNFGTYENAVQKELNDQINLLGRGDYKIHRTKEGIKFIEIPIHENILITFFQSVVWRQCIEQILDGKKSPLDVTELESLRINVYDNIYYSTKDIKSKKLANYCPMSIFTTYGTADKKTASFANPHPLNTNPLLFFLGPINLFYWLNPKVTQSIDKHLCINSNLLSSELLLENRRMAIVSSSEWKQINKCFGDIFSKQYLS